MRYKALDADEKAKWQAKADEAKEEYKHLLEEYEKTKPKESSSVPKKKKKPEPELSSDSGSDDSSVDSDSS